MWSAVTPEIPTQDHLLGVILYQPGQSSHFLVLPPEPAIWKTRLIIRICWSLLFLLSSSWASWFSCQVQPTFWLSIIDWVENWMMRMYIIIFKLLSYFHNHYHEKCAQKLFFPDSQSARPFDALTPYWLRIYWRGAHIRSTLYRRCCFENHVDRIER